MLLAKIGWLLIATKPSGDLRASHSKANALMRNFR